MGNDVSTTLVTGGRQLLDVSVWSGQRAGLEGEMLNSQKASGWVARGSSNCEGSMVRADDCRERSWVFCEEW